MTKGKPKFILFNLITPTMFRIRLPQVITITIENIFSIEKLINSGDPANY